MGLVAIIWVVCFILWVAGGFYVVTDKGAPFRGGHNGLLAVLVGILGWYVFQGFKDG